MSKSSAASALRSLQLELKKIQEEPVEGFRVRLVDESNLFEWEVAIFGPPDTLYAGGYFKVVTVTSHIIVDVFDNTPSAVNVATQLTLRCGIKILSLREAYILQWTINNDTATVSMPGDAVAVTSAHMKFPPDYPYSPPSVRFLTKMWHPNIYENGEVCISILHPPVDDPHSGELPSERWNPTQNVRTILLSIISLLNEPNTYSPANVDASVSFRRWRDSKGKDTTYKDIVTKQVLATREEAQRDGVAVPTTLAEYCAVSRPLVARQQSNYDDADFYNDDDYMEDDDDDDDEEDEDEEDSGHGDL